MTEIVDPRGCCAPTLQEPLDPEQARHLADLMKALADPVRLRLLSLIASSQTGEVCACDLTEPLDRSQPTVSHHLSILVEAGLLEREQRGRWAWFSLVPGQLQAVREALDLDASPGQPATQVVAEHLSTS